MKEEREIGNKMDCRSIKYPTRFESFKDSSNQAVNVIYFKCKGCGHYHSPDNDTPAYKEIDLSGHIIREEWYKHGKLHRGDDLPAVVALNGRKEWWIDGRRHREIGPAFIDACGTQLRYYINHRCLTKEELIQRYEFIYMKKYKEVNL